MATHTRGIQVGARGIDGNGDQLDGLGLQNPFAYRMHAHGDELLDPVGIQLGELVPVRIPVAGFAHGIAGWGDGLGLIETHGAVP
ncbi:hypothetical protein D9M68_718400 [compost metagenome]